MKASELLDLLTEFYQDKMAMRQRHIAAARLVSDYDFNNTYQYIIAREDVQLSWLRDAITEMGAVPPDVPEPAIAANGKGAQLQASIIKEDRDRAQAFLDTWKPRVNELGPSHARHRTLLNVILGETAEHRRFFDQALAGRSDLLGRRVDGTGTGGGVLPTRWVE